MPSSLSEKELIAVCEQLGFIYEQNLIQAVVRGDPAAIQHWDIQLIALDWQFQIAVMQRENALLARRRAHRKLKGRI